MQTITFSWFVVCVINSYSSLLLVSWYHGNEVGTRVKGEGEDEKLNNESLPLSAPDPTRLKVAKAEYGLNPQ